MKNAMIYVLLACVTFSLCACGRQPAGTATTPETQEETTMQTTQTQPTTDTAYDPVNDDKTLKVLAIGNSFSIDTTHYLEDIAVAEGFEKVLIGNLYIAGCTLKTHAENVRGNLPAYVFYKNYDGEWTTVTNCSLEYALKDRDWDIITMQQNSLLSGDPGSYEPYLTELIDYVNANKTNPNAKLAWNMTWAYQQNHDQYNGRYNEDQYTMYRAIVNVVHNNIVPRNVFSYIMPCGTAIQNARTSYLGDHLTRDGYHMSDMGRVITSYTWLATFTGKPLTQINFTEIIDGRILDERDKQMIMDAVNAAISKPYEVTQSAFTK